MLSYYNGKWFSSQHFGFRSFGKLKGTPGFIHCLFKAASLATLNKQMSSSFATYDALSLVNDKAKLYLVLLHIVDICSAHSPNLPYSEGIGSLEAAIPLLKVR